MLLFDFTGHGESGGDSISFGFHEAGDVRAAVDFMVEHAPGERIGAVACSMGAAALVMSTGGDSVQAMVLESMYPTIEEAVSDRIAHRLGQWSRLLTPLLLWQLEPRLGFGPEQLRPIDEVARLHASKLFIAGATDPLTRLVESERIFAQSASQKAFWIIPGAGHVDLYARAGREYEERVLAFLSTELRSSEGAER